MKIKMIAAVLLFILLIVIVIMALNEKLKIVTYNIESSKVDQPLKFALVTDLHSCFYGENQSELMDALDAFQPDVVLLGGDIIDDGLDEKYAWVFIDELTKKYKAYYVSGNHEWWSGKMQTHFDTLTSKGVRVLRGDIERMQIGNNIVNICGIDDPEVDRLAPDDTTWAEQLENVGKAIEGDSLNILLSHRPEWITSYKQYAFDLILAGHAHGGQVRIPGILNGLFAPHQGLFPKYAGGIYDFEDSTFIVSRGLANENTRLPRIYNRPELVFVCVQPK